MESNIYAILMASGFSKRFGGENKLLVPFRGKPLARHTLDLVCSLGEKVFTGIFFVYSDEGVAALVNNSALASDVVITGKAAGPLTLIHNTAPEKGQRESVRLGVEAANAGVEDYFLFLPCDQPFLDADTMHLILAARRKGCIVEPCFENKPGNPCLFSGVFRDELLSLNDGEAPRVIKERHPDAVIRVMVSDPMVLIDIDDREMLERLG